ncbi:amino acid ABC transporter substrate-binding protein [Streptococcus porcinus]|uniref:Amino acid ABC transporter extracellular amino acid-binding protein n=1 Tax=Streptococcus porcinus TaxID=1340 RepID=A0A4V0HAE1_STRPO|nr:amino acid ABC transporter substrate-binding protein [Streptococcus porcinus]VTT43376.1 amino acid ABC transporter extracellular amino acid-binding protein [Streptococcus porcinus]VTT44833.1 amino acid ABC transporter extracellular amino acid-binding protein [Streptococcus porcinus]
MKKLAMILMTVVVTTCLVACGKPQATKGDSWKTYKKEKTITLGFDNTFVPMGYKDESGKNTGFDIELAKAVFAEYGITIKFQAINWDLKETELKNGKIDMIWNGYSMTKERLAKVAFSNPYMKNEQILISKNATHINSFSDMKGKTLGAQSASSGYDAFTRYPKILKNNVKGQDATQYETFTQGFIDLKNDRIDALLIDKVYANYYLKQEGELEKYHITKSEYAGENFAVGVRKEDKTLVKMINKGFKTLYKNGKFQEISKKWFGEDVATDQVK